MGEKKGLLGGGEDAEIGARPVWVKVLADGGLKVRLE
jgi:hypothetical protein